MDKYKPLKQRQQKTLTILYKDYRPQSEATKIRTIQQNIMEWVSK